MGFNTDDMIDQEIEESGFTFLDYNKTEKPDGGYRDVCNSLILQIKQVEKMYQDQLVGLESRKKDLKNSIILDIKVSIIWLVIFLCPLCFVKICEHTKVGIVVLFIYMIIKTLLPAIALIILFFILPAYIRSLIINVRNYHIMNETFSDEIKNSDIVTFKQEERFLKDKLYNISVVLDDHKKVEAELVDEYDENWNHRMQKDVERLRKASIYREYYARGMKKEGTMSKIWYLSSILIIVGLYAIYFLYRS
jgi:hypothetical protein